MVIKEACTQSSVALYFSAVITLCDSLRGADAGFHTWATVKSYYCAFYCVRSILASNHIMLLHSEKKLYEVTSVPGQIPRRRNGTTHENCWSILFEKFPNNILNSEIGLVSGHTWLRSLREHAIYTNHKFWEPIVPGHYAKLDTLGVARCLNAYLKVQPDLAFDPDHAIVAFPVRCIVEARQRLAQSGTELDRESIDAIRMIIRGVPGGNVLQELVR